jgi:hypothetical protein
MKKNLLPILFVLLGLTSAIAQIPSNVPTNGLAGYWPFNGNANDESSNSNHGGVFGATISADRFGIANKAYSFDGVNDYIEIPNSNSLNPSALSINVWINADSSDMCILEKNNFSNAKETSYRIAHRDNWPNNLNGLSTAWGNPTTCNSINYSAVEGSPADTVANNVWQMITFTLTSNGEGKQYLNGQLLFIYTGDNFYSCNSATSKLKIGTHWFSDPEWFSGLIDDIGIWNRVLTAQEVQNLYNPVSSVIAEQNDNNILIYPNPAKTHITIDNGNFNLMNGYTVRINNSLGQTVFNQSIIQQKYFIDLSTWTGNGMYYLNIIDNFGNSIESKIIAVQ